MTTDLQNLKSRENHSGKLLYGERVTRFLTSCFCHRKNFPEAPDTRVKAFLKMAKKSKVFDFKIVDFGDSGVSDNTITQMILT
jgi:hypothetical protein